MNISKRAKIITAAVALIVVGGVAVNSTLAYLSDSRQVTNTITVGNVTVELTEPNFPKEIPNMEPGMVQAKDPMVTNTGSNPAYVRLQVKIPTAEIGKDKTTQNLFQIGNGEGAHFKEGINSSSAQINGVSVKWVLDSDGYYYLRQTNGSDYALPAGKETPKLFTSIRLNPDLREGQLIPTDESGTVLTNIDVIAQAVQTGSFSNAKEAWAAFDQQVSGT